MLQRLFDRRQVRCVGIEVSQDSNAYGISHQSILLEGREIKTAGVLRTLVTDF